MMKKWGILLFFAGILMISTNCMGWDSSELPCCWTSKINESKECCELGEWGNAPNFEYRAGACCSKINVTEAYTLDATGEFVRGAVITRECCTSQSSKGKAPGNYDFWPTKGSQSTADAPGKGGVCCIKDSWKWWSNGLNNSRCCNAQGGKEYNERCCFEAYDLDSKGHSKECCKSAEGKWENGDCCSPEKNGMAMANQMKNKLESDGTITITMSGAKVTSACCSKIGGQAVEGTSSSDPGFCCKGSMDLVSGERTKECCENASGKWMDSFCCGSWGKKVDGACKADSLPDSGSGDPG